MNSAPLRLRRRAAALDGKIQRRASPEDELAFAKMRLQGKGAALEERVDRFWSPIIYGLEQRPFVTLAVVAASGAAVGWLDDRTDAGVQRLTLRWARQLMPWITRSMLAPRAPRERC